jgi:hypothetical protein
MSRKRAYQVRPLIVYEEGRYVIQNVFSSGSINRILRNLSQDDVIEFSKEMIELQSQIDSMKGEKYVS